MHPACTAGKGFARGLGVRSASAAEEGSRSSFRPVKTDDGEYLVWVEAFSLTFRCVSHRHRQARQLAVGAFVQQAGCVCDKPGVGSLKHTPVQQAV